MSIELYKQKELLRKSDILIPITDRKSLISYYKEEIERLNQVISDKEKSIKDLKNAINKFSKEKEQLQFLRRFKDHLTINCISGNTQLTLYQCSNRIKKKQCTFFNQCKPRKELLNEFQAKNI